MKNSAYVFIAVCSGKYGVDQNSHSALMLPVNNTESDSKHNQLAVLCLSHHYSMFFMCVCAREQSCSEIDRRVEKAG